jgi:hypothetical protein
MKELKASNALLNNKLQYERRVERERSKKEREKEKEKKAQEQAQKKQQKEKENLAIEARKNYAIVLNNPSYNLQETGI